MSIDAFRPAAVLVLADDEPIRAYVHPTRMAILSLLAREPMTATGLARELGVPPANLTRHLRLLGRTGLIRLVEKRDTGRNLEKYYRAAAFAFDVRMTSDRVADRRATALAILRDSLSTAVATARGPAPGDVVGLLEHTRVCAGDLPELERRLRALAAEFATLDSGDGRPYCLSLALYPAEAAGAPAGRRVVLGGSAGPEEER